MVLYPSPAIVYCPCTGCILILRQIGDNNLYFAGCCEDFMNNISKLFSLSV